jgi:DNA-binding transcriptional LysR family regulator
LHRAAITNRDEAGMEIRQLTYFVIVAEELNFGRAAQRLHIVQPAVSQQIRRLERELGLQLFDRSSRHVRLTSAGERLLLEARAVLAAADRVHELATQIAAGTDATLRLGTSQGIGERLERILEQLAASAPGLQVRLVSVPADERIARVRRGELDAAVVRTGTAAPGVDLRPLWDDSLSVALPATHALAAEPLIQLQQLSDIPLRLAPREDNPPFYDAVLAACADAGFQPRLGPPFTTAEDTLAQIGTGPPFWTVLYTAAADRMSLHRVAFRPLAALTTRTFLAVPTGPASPTLRQLLDACATVTT